MTKSDTGRKARQNGRAFEQAIARDLRAWLGPEWSVVRNPPDVQGGKDGRAGEFNATWVGSPHCLHCDAVIPLDAKWPWMGTCSREAGHQRSVDFMEQEHPICYELKRVAAFKTDQLWKHGVSAAFRGFWSQAVEQAEAVGKHPWLVLREPPRGPVLLVMRSAHFVRLMTASGYPAFCRLTLDVGVHTLVVLPWSAFLEAVPASALWELS